MDDVVRVEKRESLEDLDSIAPCQVGAQGDLLTESLMRVQHLTVSGGAKLGNFSRTQLRGTGLKPDHVGDDVSDSDHISSSLQTFLVRMWYFLRKTKKSQIMSSST